MEEEIKLSALEAVQTHHSVRGDAMLDWSSLGALASTCKRLRANLKASPCADEIEHIAALQYMLARRRKGLEDLKVLKDLKDLTDCVLRRFPLTTFKMCAKRMTQDELFDFYYSKALFTRDIDASLYEAAFAGSKAHTLRALLKAGHLTGGVTNMTLLDALFEKHGSIQNIPRHVLSSAAERHPASTWRFCSSVATEADLYDCYFYNWLFSHRVDIESYIAVFHRESHHRFLALRYAGHLTGRVTAEWLVEHIRKKDLVAAFRECGMHKLQTMVITMSMDRIAEIFKGTDGGLVIALRFAMLLTPAIGVDWLQAHLKGPELLDVLEASGLSRTVDKDRLATMFDGGSLLAALVRLGHMTPAIGVAWLTKHFRGNDLEVALRRADLLRTVDLDYLVANIERPRLFAVLKDTDKLADVGVDWLARHFKGRMLIDVLADSGRMKGASPDWLATHFKGRLLKEALIRAGLFKADIDWYSSFVDPARPYLEPDPDWLARHFDGDELLDVLEESGHTVDRDWVDAHFDGDACVLALLRLTLLAESLPKLDHGPEGPKGFEGSEGPNGRKIEGGV